MQVTGLFRSKVTQINLRYTELRKNLAVLHCYQSLTMPSCKAQILQEDCDSQMKRHQHIDNGS